MISEIEGATIFGFSSIDEANDERTAVWLEDRGTSFSRRVGVRGVGGVMVEFDGVRVGGGRCVRCRRERMGGADFGGSSSSSPELLGVRILEDFLGLTPPSITPGGGVGKGG